MDEDTIEKLEEAKGMLQSIVGDHSVPKNIRRAAKQASTVLEVEEDEPTVRANFAISLLDEVSQDPNCKSYTRTTLWSVVSILETIRE